MKNSIKVALTSKWKIILEEYEKVKNKNSVLFTKVEDICNAYHVSRKDIRKYYGRWKISDKNENSLLPQKRGPKPGQLKVLTKEEERVIIKIRRRLDSNEFEIHELIKGHFNIHPSVSTIYRTLKRYPLNKKRKEIIKRYEKSYPGEQVHVDSYILPSSLFIDNKKRYLSGIIDDCTRLCYVDLMNHINSAESSIVFAKAIKWFYLHGITVEEALTDNGCEFTAYTSKKAREKHFFETMLHIMNVKHKYTKPYRPQTNGKIERFWKTLNKEFILQVHNKLQNEQEFIEELNSYMYNYNYKRKHYGLKFLTPFEKLNFVTEIVKSYTPKGVWGIQTASLITNYQPLTTELEIEKS